MKTINDLKKWNYRDEGWYDENNQIVKIIWSEKVGKCNIEHSIRENIEKTTIDGIEYTHLCYIYGEGLVIADATERYIIKVSDLKTENTIEKHDDNKNETKNDNSNIEVNSSNTCIIKNTIQSIHRFADNTIIVLNNQKYKITLNNYENLSDEDIETRYGSFATDDEVLKELYSTNYIYNFEIVN